MGHGPGVLEGDKEEKIGIIAEGNVFNVWGVNRIAIGASLEDAKFNDRRRVDGTTIRMS